METAGSPTRVIKWKALLVRESRAGRDRLIGNCTQTVTDADVQVSPRFLTSLSYPNAAIRTAEIPGALQTSRDELTQPN
jgi:hypothetical protein